jgi:hypothetical protein
MQSIARRGHVSAARGRLVQPTLLSGTAIGMVAIGMDVAIGIGGTVDGGPMVLALVGEWSLAGFGSVTDST